jgi:hypothetical protein
VNESNSLLGVQGSNFINDIPYGQGLNVDKIYFTYIDYLLRGKSIAKEPPK